MNRACRFHLRQRANALQSILDEGGATWQAPSVFAEDQHHSHGQNMIGAVSRIDVVQQHETAQHQARTDDEDHRDRDLRDHQRVAQPATRT